MIVFAKANGTIIDVMPSPVYQGSNLSGSIYFVAPLANLNAVTVAFKLPNGILTKPYRMTLVSKLDGVTDKLGEEYNVWEWQDGNAEITEYAGVCVARFSVYLPNGKLLTTSRTSFNVEEGVPPIMPDEPTEDVYELILRYLAQLDSRTKNVPNLVASIQKVASNAFTYTNNSNVESAPIVLIGGEEAPMPVTPASTITIPKEADGWHPIYDSDETAIIGYKHKVEAALHGQMRDGATANDLWVSFSANETDVLDGKYADYTVDGEGNITVTVSEPVDLAMRVWNGKGLVDNVARADIKGETERAVTEEEKLQKQITELQNTGVDNVARAEISELADMISENSSDISSLREDITKESHFRGMFNNTFDLISAYPSATPNDYAWIAGGNIWIWQNGGWEDSGVPVPSTAVPASSSTPLMDGNATVGNENSYARGDHRHPRDTYVYSPDNPPPIDSTLSTTSENPVQNKVVTTELNNKVDKSGDSMDGKLTVNSDVSTHTIDLENLSYPFIRFRTTASENTVQLEQGTNGKLYFVGRSKTSSTNRYLLYIPEKSGTIACTSDLLSAFPVGSIITNNSGTSPASYLGGTWTKKIGVGQVENIYADSGYQSVSSGTSKILYTGTIPTNCIAFCTATSTCNASLSTIMSVNINGNGYEVTSRTTGYAGGGANVSIVLPPATNAYTITSEVHNYDSTSRYYAIKFSVLLIHIVDIYERTA